MFKFIHTSDWHLGQNFYSYDRNEEQRDFLRQLADIVHEHTPDALLVSGDVYHAAAPSNAAVNLYVDEMLNIHEACPTMAIIVIAGNHDSASRLDSDKRLWKRAGVNVLGGIARDKDGFADLNSHIITVKDKGIVAAVPFAYPGSFPLTSDANDIVREQRQRAYFQALLDQANNQNGGNLPVVLMAHLAVSNSDCTGHSMKMECVELDALGHGYDYAALGHIHRPQNLSDRTRYSGTPVPVSFDEQCEHSVSIVTIEGHNAMPLIEKIGIKNLKPLHTIPANDPVDFDEALKLAAMSRDIAGAYIRLNVKTERYLPNGAQERAARTINEMSGRFCEIKNTSSVVTSRPQQQMTVEELNNLRPVEVAKRYFLREYNREMTEQELEMFNYVYQLIQEEDRR